MNTRALNVLLVEDNPDYASSVQAALATGEDARFNLTVAGSLNQAFETLERERFHVILLDLSLPDSAGLGTFSELHTRAAHVPIVILTILDDRALALQALREGAQDYLIKEEIGVAELERALLYAVERHRLWFGLLEQSLKDELTGLLNRRGFLTLAQQQLKIAQRENLNLILLFADLDGLKGINDSRGHPQGDAALRAVAGILSETFRTSDLIARLGGDEFVVLAVNAQADCVQSLQERLQENLGRHNARQPRYPLSLSFGVAQSEARQLTNLDELIARADQALYENKRGRRG